MSTPLRTLVNDLLHEPAARAAFAADPTGYLGGHGWEDLDGDDVGAVFAELGHELPIDEAVRLGSVDAGGFADGPAGALDGLRAAVAAFEPDWSDDPSEGIDADDLSLGATEGAHAVDNPTEPGAIGFGAPADDDDEPGDVPDVGGPEWNHEDEGTTSWFDAPDEALAGASPFAAGADADADDGTPGWADPEELDHG